MRGIVTVRMLQESVAFAFSQLRGDKFRTFLSLLGVSIGIFSIVAVFTAVDALEDNVRRGFEAFGSDMVIIDKWPMMPEDPDGSVDMSGEYKWWEYMKRPSPDYKDYLFLKENSRTAEAVAMLLAYERSVKAGRNSLSNCTVKGVTSDWEKISRVNLLSGRYFNESEINNGSAVCVVGYRVWEELFDGASPLGRRIKVGGRDLTVIGLLDKEGESMVNIGGGTDASLLVPLKMCKYIVNMRRAGASILVKPKADVQIQEFEDELVVLMRAGRRIAPVQKNNFSINRMTMLLQMVDSIFSMLNSVGWVIAGFSLLIGGFGIANIMFVSVKERTNIIGIQKALGAKKYMILSQFLVESVFLALAGGIVGIILLAVIVLALPQTGMFVMQLSFDNIMSGLIIASVIGVMSGMAPAYAAANLDPVVAINSK